MANGLYTEATVKRKVTGGMQLGKYGLIALAIILFVFGLLSGQTILSILGVIGFGALYFVLPRFNVEYEYVYCDGQIDFDSILGGEKRKHLYRIDLDNVEIMAPDNSHRMDSYKNIHGVVKKDLTSREEGRNVYAIYLSNGADKAYITFEPSATMLDYARQKAPRKMFMD